MKWFDRSPQSIIIPALLAFAGVFCAPSSALGHPAIESRIENADRRIAVDPGNARLYLERGELHRLHRRWEVAESDFLRSLELDTDLALAEYRLAQLRFETGRSSEALGSLQRYLAARPGDPPGLALRGRIRVSLGDSLEAAGDFGRAIDATIVRGGQPQPELFLERSGALAAAGGDHLTEALAGIDSGLVRLGQPLTLELEALELEVRLGRIDAALARIDRRLDSSRNPGPWWMRRGEILAEAGRDQEAVDACGRALEAFEALPDHRRAAPAIARRVEALRDMLRRLAGEPIAFRNDHDD